MAGSRAALNIEVTADTSRAISGLDKAEQAVKNYADAADIATRQSRDVSGAIDSVGGVAGGATTGLRDMSDAIAMAGFPELAAGMGVTATALESLDGAATLYAAAQEGLSKAVAFFNGVLQALKLTILTNPIFIIAAVIIAIGAAFVIAYMKCETFRNIVDGAVDAVWNTIKTVYGWIRDNWPLLAAILMGPFGIAVLAIVRNWDTIEDAIRGVYNWIRSAWDNLYEILTSPFRSAWNVISGIFDRIKDAIGTVTNLINKIPKPPSWVPIIGGSSVAATAAPAVARAGGLAAPAVRSTPSINVTVNTTGLGASSPQIQRAVVNALRGHVARNGALDIPVRGA